MEKTTKEARRTELVATSPRIRDASLLIETINQSNRIRRGSSLSRVEKESTLQRD